MADLITGLIEKTNVRMEDIGVMAPYRRQVRTPITEHSHLWDFIDDLVDHTKVPQA